MSHPNLSGLWVARLQQGRQGPEKLTIRIEQEDDYLHAEMHAKFGDDTRSVVFDLDLSPSAPATSARAVWDDDVLVIETPSPGGVLRDYWTLSSDGNLLSMAHKSGVFAGQRVFFDRVAYA